MTTDPAAFSNTMTDLAMGQVPEPIWAKYNFLERDLKIEQNKDEKTVVKEEIEKLKHECGEFGNELQKAQELLKLQDDIQRENEVFYRKEVQRLTLIEKSSKSKLEELSRRVDEKQRSINEYQNTLARLTQSRGLSPQRRTIEELDKESEFSLAS